MPETNTVMMNSLLSSPTVDNNNSSSVLNNPKSDSESYDMAVYSGKKQPSNNNNNNSKKCYQNWANTTTMHGPAHARQATTKCGATFWYVLITVSCTVMMPQLYLLINQYLDPHSNWSTSIYDVSAKNGGLPLPNMVICNFNRLKRSAVDRLNFTKELGLSSILTVTIRNCGTIYSARWIFARRIIAHAGNLHHFSRTLKISLC